MVLQFTSEREFTPKWNNNEAEDNPIVVRHKAPSVALFNQLIPKPVLKFVTGKDGEAEGSEVEMTIDNTKVVRQMVTEIRNFELIDSTTGNKIKIEKAGDLFGENVPPAVNGLIDEIGQHLTLLLQKKAFDEKN
jgi:hypothetical protein